jgi:hypothetical protein
LSNKNEKDRINEAKQINKLGTYNIEIECTNVQFNDILEMLDNAEIEYHYYYRTNEQ